MRIALPKFLTHNNRNKPCSMPQSLKMAYYIAQTMKQVVPILSPTALGKKLNFAIQTNTS